MSTPSPWENSDLVKRLIFVAEKLFYLESVELRNLLDVSAPSLSRYRRGKGGMSRDRWEALVGHIEKKFGYSQKYLLGPIWGTIAEAARDYYVRNNTPLPETMFAEVAGFDVPSSEIRDLEYEKAIESNTKSGLQQLLEDESLRRLINLTEREIKILSSLRTRSSRLMTKDDYVSYLLVIRNHLADNADISNLPPVEATKESHARGKRVRIHETVDSGLGKDEPIIASYEREIPPIDTSIEYQHPAVHQLSLDPDARLRYNISDDELKELDALDLPEFTTVRTLFEFLQDIRLRRLNPPGEQAQANEG